MYAGVDEAGRGPVIGPLVVAGVAGRPDQIPDGVDDSKRLRPDRRERLATCIQASPLTVAVRTITAEELNQRMDGGENLNLIETHAFADVLRALNPEQAIVDQVGPDEDAFAKELSTCIGQACSITARAGADASDPMVAAASILAKVERDDAIARIAERLQADVGSGYPSDPVTRDFLEDWRKTSIHPPPHTRHAWGTLDAVGFGQMRLGEQTKNVDGQTRPAPAIEDQPEPEGVP